MSTKEDQIIVSGRHQTGVLLKMKSLRMKSIFCDVTLQIGDVKIAAHKVVLAASSPFFEFMFTTDKIKESKMDCIPLKDVCPTAFSVLIDFMYTGCLLVKEDNIMELLEVADHFKVADAKMECLSYLQKHITISNCISIRNMAEKYYFTELAKKVNSFICYNLVDVIKTEGFLNLSLEEEENCKGGCKGQRSSRSSLSMHNVICDVKKFITEESFCASTNLCEQAISSWIEYDKIERKQFHDELSRTSSFHYESIFKRGGGVYNALQQRQVLFSTKETSSSEVIFLDLNNLSRRSARRRPSFQSVCSIFHKNSICLIGEKSNECAVYNLEKEDWRLNKMPFNNSYCGGCGIHDQIYLISTHDSRATFSYDVETNNLIVQPCLMNKRTAAGVAFDGWCIFVCGGGTASVERRDLRTKEWRSISDLPKRIDICSATSLDQQLYCACLEGSFYQYDPRNGVWMEKAAIQRSTDGSKQNESCGQSGTFRFSTVPPQQTNTFNTGIFGQATSTPTQTSKPITMILGSTDQVVHSYNGQSLCGYVPALNVWEEVSKMSGYTDFVCVYPKV